MRKKKVMLDPYHLPNIFIGRGHLRLRGGAGRAGDAPADEALGAGESFARGRAGGHPPRAAR